MRADNHFNKVQREVLIGQLSAARRLRKLSLLWLLGHPVLFAVVYFFVGAFQRYSDFQYSVSAVLFYALFTSPVLIIPLTAFLTSNFRVRVIERQLRCTVQRKKYKIALGLCACFLLLICWFIGKSYNEDPGFRRSRSMDRAEIIGQAAREFFLLKGKWPQSISELTAEQQWADLKTNDAWGTEIDYLPFNSTNGYGKVTLFGADKKRYGVGLAGDSIHIFMNPTSTLSQWDIHKALQKEYKINYKTNY